MHTHINVRVGKPGDPNLIGYRFYDSEDEQQELMVRRRAPRRRWENEPAWICRKVGAQEQEALWSDSYIRAKLAGMLHADYAKAAGLIDDDGHYI